MTLESSGTFPNAKETDSLARRIWPLEAVLGNMQRFFLHRRILRHREPLQTEYGLRNVQETILNRVLRCGNVEAQQNNLFLSRLSLKCPDRSVTSFGGRQDIHGDRQDGRESLKAVTFQS